MAIVESVTRLAASFITIIRTRVELASVELEEELLNLFSYLLYSLMALFCLCMAIFLTVLMVVALYWDTHRIVVLAGMGGIFGLTGLAAGVSVRNNYRKSPRLLSYTLTELSKDVDSLAASSKST